MTKPNMPVGRPFKPGVSGNPTGRPKSAPHMRKRCRDIVDEKVIDAWEKEVTERGPQWVKCSELLAAYGYGPPAKAQLGDGDGAGDDEALRGLTDEQVAQLAAQKLSTEH